MKALTTMLVALGLMLTSLSLTACRIDLKNGTNILGNDKMHHGEQIVSEQSLSASINQIKASRYLKVVLHYSDTPKLKITAPSADRKLTIKEEKDGTLVIFEDKKTFNTQDGAFLIDVFTPTPIKDCEASGGAIIEIADIRWDEKAEIQSSGVSSISAHTLSVANELSLDVSGASHITIDTLRCQELELDCSGASSLNLSDLVVHNLEGDCSGASRIKMAGEADYIKLDASGASHINAASLVGRRGDLSASGASKVNIKSISDEISLKASGASKIHYNGTPKVVSMSSSGASTIKAN